MSSTVPVTVVLLKTRSQPHDTYEEYFSGAHPVGGAGPGTATGAGPAPGPANATPRFEAVFVPVLEHKQDVHTLHSLGQSLRDGNLKQNYGGMIFTSQRAVEAWADTVRDVEHQCVVDPLVGLTGTDETAIDTRSNVSFTTDAHRTSNGFPLYTVGPATSRALTTLISQSSALSSKSPFADLNPRVSGAHTGNGANLAQYIMRHYNGLHAQTWFEYYEAPRLPFVPLIGMGSENYSRKRLESDDVRLAKKPLLFLVGEQRRDIIPKTLMQDANGSRKIVVNEVEVYSTTVLQTFRREIDSLIHRFERSNSVNHPQIVVVVIFSPQGSEDTLKALGLMGPDGRATEQAKRRWDNVSSTPSNMYEDGFQGSLDRTPQYIIATIGPTTRDYLRAKLGFEPDVCATKPSPEGIREAILAFLVRKGLWSE